METLISARVPFWQIDVRSLWNSRYLLFLFIRRDFLVTYKNTVLGPLWALFQPILMAGLFTIVFTQITRISTNGTPPILFYFSALVLWNYFSQIILGITESFPSQTSLMGKVYFPRLLLPLSIVGSKSIQFLFNLTPFLIIYSYFRLEGGHSFSLGPTIFFLPLTFLAVTLLALGFGLFFAAISFKIKDIKFLVGLLTQIWMYATPIIYPASLIPEKFAWLLKLNPMASFMESYRAGWFNTENLGAPYYGFAVLISMVVLIMGLFFFQKVERVYIDSI